jgi:hypothetical protein
MSSLGLFIQCITRRFDTLGHNGYRSKTRIKNASESLRQVSSPKPTVISGIGKVNADKTKPSAFTLPLVSDEAEKPSKLDVNSSSSTD